MTIDINSFLKKTAATVLIFAILYFGKSFFIPLAFGLIFAALLLPFCQWLEKLPMARALAAFLCLFSFVLLLSAVGALIVWQVSDLTGDVSLFKQRALTMFADVQNFLENKWGISLQQQWQDYQTTPVGQWLAGSFVYLLIQSAFVLAYVFLILLYRDHIRTFIVKLSQPSERQETNIVINNVAGVSQKYMLGLAKMIACLWIMYGIGFSALGVKHAFFFAIVCGLLEIVPFVGNITGTSITILVAVAEGSGVLLLAGILLVYLLIQFIQGWFLEPLILGPQVKLNPFATILALVIGELVWGLPGVFLAIPVTAMIKIICDHIEPLKPYGFLIGHPGKKKRFQRKTIPT